jgi:hypothetical protein
VRPQLHGRPQPGLFQYDLCARIARPGGPRRRCRHRLTERRLLRDPDDDIRRFGFSHVVSSGNEVVLAAADYLEYLADDAYTKIIGAFIETVRQPERFAAALDRAKEAGKPVVVLKVGRASLISFSSSDPGFRS